MEFGSYREQQMYVKNVIFYFNLIYFVTGGLDGRIPTQNGNTPAKTEQKRSTQQSNRIRWTKRFHGVRFDMEAGRQEMTRQII